MDISFKHKKTVDSAYKSEFFPRLADRSWRIILIASSVIVLIIAIASIQKLMFINSDSFIKEAEVASSGEKINRTRLETVIKYFAEKQDATNKIRSQKSKITDPSL